MAIYKEYALVSDVRERYLKAENAPDDTLILDFIREASKFADAASGRFFYPLIQTRKLDAVADLRDDGSILALDWDCLSLTTITNGDASTISANNYVTEPRNDTPYWAVKLLASSNLAWTYTSDPENAISIAAIWGYHADYANAWVDTGATLAAAISNTTGTTFTCTTAKLKSGMLVKIDSEFLYVSSVAPSTNDTITVVRGVNGSTAATHLISAPVSVWTVDPALQGVIWRAAAALYRLRDNPIADTVVIDGQSFATPKDVQQFIKQQIIGLGLVK